MSDLRRHLGDYLAVRRALGFKLRRDATVLGQFVEYLEAAGAETVTANLAVAWAGLPQGVQPIEWTHRLGAVRGFARYLTAIDPATELPPSGVWPTRTPRRTPYLWPEADVARLLEATQSLKPPLRAATYGALFGLLAATGMRIGEAIAMSRNDVDLSEGVVTINEAKFERARLLPLHPSTTAALVSYAVRRDELCPNPKSGTFFVSSVGTALIRWCVEESFVQLTSATGLRSGMQRPRIHDLRHSFAVRTLLEWHRSGGDVGERMAILSDYLGHASPSSTFWYLWASPELMQLAAQRLDAAFGRLR